MNINELLEKQNLTKYRLSKLSGIPQTTINDICNGKADLEKCSAGTIYRLAKSLNVSMEELLDPVITEQRSSFEIFKSNTCHSVKDLGDMEFIVTTLENDSIRVLYKRKWYPEALYLLAMIDYLSRINNLPICTNYNDIRTKKLSRKVYPIGVLTNSKVLNSDKPLKEAEKDCIPEFKRFNIIESEIRNVI